MGNCVQSSRAGSGGGGAHHGAGGGEGSRRGQIQRTMEGHDQGASTAPAPSVVKVRMVLTKGELGRLVARLGAGDRRLEDVLREIAARSKRRGGGGGVGEWRPSLERIVECPAETACSDG